MSARNDSEKRNESELRDECDSELGCDVAPIILDRPHSPAPLPPPINLRIIKNIDYPSESGRLEYLLYGRWIPVPVVYED